MPEDLGTLQIGISADTSQLDKALADVQRKVKEFKIPEREIPIRVRVATPTEDAIKKAQARIDQTLTKAQKLGVTLTPTLTVGNATIGAFRKEIQSKLQGTDPIAVPMKADVDGKALRDQILSELGIVDIPLTWHWQGEPPPGSGPFPYGPGGGGGGGGGPTSPPTTGGGGGQAKPRQQKTGPATGPTTAAVVVPSPTQEPAQPVKAQAAKSAPAKIKAKEQVVVAGATPAAPQPVVNAAAQKKAYEDAIAAAGRGEQVIDPDTGKPLTAASSYHAITELRRRLKNLTAPANAAPAAPVAAAPAAAAAPTVVGIRVPTFTKTKAGEAPAGSTLAEREAAQIAHAAMLLTRGQTGGLTELLRLGGVLHPGSPDQPFTAKKNSALARYLGGDEQREPALREALRRFQAGTEVEEGRPAFTGSARGLAGGLPNIQSPQSVRRIREIIAAEARERSVEFRKRADVQQIRAAFKEQGFAALDPQLEAARGMITQDPVKAREMAISALAQIWSGNPKVAAALFPSKKRSVKVVSPTKFNEAGEEVANPKYNAGFEAQAAGVSALLGEIFKVSLPLRDERSKEERMQMAAEIKERQGEPVATKGAVAAATSKASREKAAFELGRAGLSRARIADEVAPEPLDYSADRAFRDAEIKRIMAETQTRERLVKRDGKIAKIQEQFKPFTSLELAGPEFNRRYPSVNIPGRAGGGPVQGRIRLYRGDTHGHGSPAPDWVKETQQYRDTVAASGRWFTHSPEIAQEYVDHFGTGGPGKVSSVIVGRRQHEKFRLSNMSMEGLSLEERLRHPRRFSADPENEWFLPRSVADRAKPWPGRAAGGPIKGGLMDRLAAARMKDAYRVGENKPETYVSKSGLVGIVGQHGEEIRQFPEDGQIVPYVPQWVQRMQKNAKDLTHRLPGGAVRGATGGLFRAFVPGEKEAIAGNLLSKATSSDVQRVFVVNWPSALGARPAAGAPAVATAGSPVTMPFAPGGSPAPILERAIESGIAKVARKAKRTRTKAGPAAEPAEDTGATGKERLDPLEELDREIALLKTQTARQFDIQLLSAERTSQLQQVPARGVQTALGEISATTLGGRSGIIQRSRLAQGAAQIASAYSAKAAVEERALGKAINARDAAMEKGLEPNKKTLEQIDIHTKRLARLHQEYDLAHQTAETFNKDVASGGEKLRVFGTNTAGIVTGTLLFSTVLGAAQAGLEGIGTVLSPVLQRMTGFQALAARMTDEMSTQAQSAGGDAKSVVQLAEANAGLGTNISATITPLLTQATATAEGNKQLEAQLDQIHVAENIRRQGGDKGLFATTGGFAGTALGGLASTQELIKNELSGADVTLSQGELAQRQQAQAGVTTNQIVAGRYSFPGTAQSTGDILAKSNDKLATLNDRMQLFNDDIKAGGSSLHFMQTESQALADQFGGAAEKAGLTELGQAAHINRVILVDENNQPVFEKEALRGAVQAANVGSQAPNPDILIQQLQNRQIPAQLNQINAEATFQRQAVLPGQAALEAIANPTPGLRNPLTGRADAFSAGIVATGDKTAAKIANSYRTQVGGAINDVNKMIAEGATQLVQIVPQNLQGEFQGLLQNISATGQQIQGLQLGQQQMQVNYQVHQYNNELRLARRSLQDARDLEAGLAGKTTDTLGGLEGQNEALQRQLQLMGFALAQRQINFQLATAGFVAPGTTPEERAARIEEAKQEAEFAQKQLNLQKQIASNQFKSIHITADRNVEDIIRQVRLLQEGRDVTIRVAAASRALDVLNKKQALLVQQAGTYIQQGVQVTQAAISAASQVEAQTGKAFSYILGKTANAWGIFGRQAELILNGLQGTAPGGATRSGGFTGHGERSARGVHGASGLIGDTLGPTQMTIGEAGHEKVAVLKNPRVVSLLPQGGPGSAPPSITVIVTGNNISDSASEDRLAHRIAQTVEASLMRKTSLFGLRRV